MSESSSLTPGKSLESDLRLIREAKGLTREDVFNRVHIRPEVLTQVEEFGFAATPTLSSDIHRRSFVKHYADAIEIDASIALQALNQSIEGSYDGLLARAFLDSEQPGEPRWAAADDPPVVDRPPSTVEESSGVGGRIDDGGIIGPAVAKTSKKTSAPKKKAPPETPVEDVKESDGEVPPPDAIDGEDEAPRVKVISSESMEDDIPDAPPVRATGEIPFDIVTEDTPKIDLEEEEGLVDQSGSADEPAASAEMPPVETEEESQTSRLDSEEPEPDAEAVAAEPDTKAPGTEEETVSITAKEGDEPEAALSSVEEPVEDSRPDGAMKEAAAAVEVPPVEIEQESPVSEIESGEAESGIDVSVAKPDTSEADGAEEEAAPVAEEVGETIQVLSVDDDERDDEVDDAVEDAVAEEEVPEKEESTSEDFTRDEPVLEEEAREQALSGDDTRRAEPSVEQMETAAGDDAGREPAFEDGGAGTVEPIIPESPYAPPIPGVGGEAKPAASATGEEAPKLKQKAEKPSETHKRRRSRRSAPLPIPEPPIEPDRSERAPAERRESWSHVRSRHWITWLGLLGVLVVVSLFLVRSFTHWLSVDKPTTVQQRSSISMEALPERFSGFVRRDDTTEEFVTLVIGASDTTDPNVFEFRMWTHSAGSLYAMTGEASLTNDGEQINLPEPYGTGGVFVSEEGEVRMRSVRRVEFPRWEFTGQIE